MALPVTEDFTGDNDPLSGRTGWTTLVTLSDSGKSSAGTLQDEVNTSDKGAYRDDETFADGQYAQIVVAGAVSGTTRVGLVVRASTSTKVATLMRYVRGGGFEAYVWNSGGTRNALSGNPHTPSDTVTVGTILKVEIDDATDTLSLFADYGLGGGFVSEGTWDASSGNASGQAGLYIVSGVTNGLEGDDWEAGDLGGGGGLGIPIAMYHYRHH